MPVKKGEEYEIAVSDMAFGGRGVGRIDGFTVFVDKTVPLDVARVKIIRKKSSYAEAVPVALLHPSPYRVTPPCSYSDICGGCKWQFVTYEKQLSFKEEQVRDSIRRIGGISDVPVHPAIPSPDIFRYRNKMEFSCSDRRWVRRDELSLPALDRSFALGLHIPGTFDKIMDIEACLLQHEYGDGILNSIRSLMKGSGAPPYGLKSHKGFWRFVTLRRSEAYDEWMVNIVTAFEDDGPILPIAAMLKDAYPKVRSVMNNITSKISGIAVGEKEKCISGESKIRDRVGGFEFEISANSFFQVNTRNAKNLFDTAKRFAGLTGSESVLDLYSGTGAVAIYFSDSAASVTGIEISESAVADALLNARLNSITNCRFICADMLRITSLVDFLPDVMVIDPPRTGMHPKVVSQVMSLAPPRMVYISCNPATLARDLGLMKGKYEVLEIQPVDMFPHTPHIETVVKLNRR
ncbi:MAG: 23S rRNA (uracil(1939)-C(5))-methyltransferase RlmD [Thermodesulfobacteriota bacterium]